MFKGKKYWWFYSKYIIIICIICKHDACEVNVFSVYYERNSLTNSVWFWNPNKIFNLKTSFGVVYLK